MVSNHLRDAALLRRERRHTEEETGEDVKYNGVDMSHIVESRGFKILSQYRMVDSTTQRLNSSTSHRLGASILVLWSQGRMNAPRQKRIVLQSPRCRLIGIMIVAGLLA